jgi:hypothetical protein
MISINKFNPLCMLFAFFLCLCVCVCVFNITVVFSEELSGEIVSVLIGMDVI